MTCRADLCSCPAGHASPSGRPKIPASFLALAASVALAVPATAGDAPSPAAECAALWYGRDDYAKRSAYLDADPGGLTLARGLRDAAVRLNGGEAAPVDAFIARERRYWALVTESYVYAGNADSRKLYDDQLGRCDAVAAAVPETRDLR